MARGPPPGTAAWHGPQLAPAAGPPEGSTGAGAATVEQPRCPILWPGPARVPGLRLRRVRRTGPEPRGRERGPTGIGPPPRHRGPGRSAGLPPGNDKGCSISGTVI
eukprot:746968-Hanusia_phi.AAC.3